MSGAEWVASVAIIAGIAGTLIGTYIQNNAADRRAKVQLREEERRADLAYNIRIRDKEIDVVLQYLDAVSDVIGAIVKYKIEDPNNRIDYEAAAAVEVHTKLDAQTFRANVSYGWLFRNFKPQEANASDILDLTKTLLGLVSSGPKTDTEHAGAHELLQAGAALVQAIMLNLKANAISKPMQ